MIDPGTIGSQNHADTRQMTLQEFWQGKSDDPLLQAQHQHLKELSKQIGYELHYGEWPSALISKDRLAAVIEQAGERHETDRVKRGKHKGAKRPFCEIIREEIRKSPEALNSSPSR